MKWNQLEAKARELTEDEVKDCLTGLVSDVRFPAVVRLLLEQERLAAESSCALQFANNHGCLAHAAGVRYTVMETIGRLKQVCEPPKRRGEGVKG